MHSSALSSGARRTAQSYYVNYETMSGTEFIQLISTMSLNKAIVAVFLRTVCIFFILACLDLEVLCKIPITIGVLALNCQELIVDVIYDLVLMFL